MKHNILLLLGITLLILSVSASETNCDSCEDCSNKLDGNYTTVKLTTDILCSGWDSCVEFNANNTEFDCQGHLIEGGELGVYTDGISIDFKSGNTVRNCVVTTFRFGLSLAYSYNNTITNNTLSNNNYGLYLGYSYNNTLTGNTANSNDYNGVFFLYSTNNTLTGNQVNLNGYYGIYFENSYNNTLNSNRVCSNTGSDFYQYSGSGNSGDQNTCDNPQDWSDTGTTGCTYDCAAVTTTSTTTSTTTTTIAGECTLAGDTEPCGTITLSEVIDFITLWSADGAILSEVIDLINAWAAG